MSAHRIIADFMKASTPIEQHLQLGRPLATLQLDSISLTVEGLETFLSIWKKKHGITESTRAVDTIEKLAPRRKRKE